MVTLPAEERHHPLTGTKLYCLVTEAYVCEQLAQGRYMKWNGRDSNPRPVDSESTTPQHCQCWCCLVFDPPVFYF